MTALDDLPPLREVVQRHGLRATKALGQNFLFDLNITAKIARAAGPLDDATVVEIGPGPGGLTRALLAAGAARVVAVERDERCLPALAEIAARYPGRLEVIHADALALDLAAQMAGTGNVRIVANLPYNVATPLLIGWLSGPWPPWYAAMTLMFQREVALRICAAPSEEAYGRLAVLAGWRTHARMRFDIPPSAFVPPPKVVSTVVALEPITTPLPCAVAALERVTAAAFGQRRKMLRQSLKSLGADPLALIEAAGLDPTQRAETVPIEGFVKLANAFERSAS